MFNILKWIFWIVFLLVFLYVLLIVYRNLKSYTQGQNINQSVSSFFDNFGIETKENLVSTETLKEFFTPRYVSPMTVVPSEDWYINMDRLYAQIYKNNLNALESDNYFNALNKYNSYQNLKIENNANQNSGLKLLFPSSWMENLKY